MCACTGARCMHACMRSGRGPWGRTLLTMRAHVPTIRPRRAPGNATGRSLSRRHATTATVHAGERHVTCHMSHSVTHGGVTPGATRGGRRVHAHTRVRNAPGRFLPRCLVRGSGRAGMRPARACHTSHRALSVRQILTCDARSSAPQQKRNYSCGVSTTEAAGLTWDHEHF